MKNEVYLIDCMEYMATLLDKQFDLAIVDPPYGIGADNKNSTHKKQSVKSATNSNYFGSQKWDNNIPDENYFNELKRISKNQIIWGANYFGLIGGYIFWNKKVTMPTYSQGELAYCSFINSVKYFKYEWHGMIQQNMKNKEKRIHPTQKPVALYKWLLQNYAKPGQTIFDSHVGSGSIRIACYDMGFDFVGCELDPDYWQAQEERFKNYTSQKSLFDTGEIQDLIYNG